MKIRELHFLIDKLFLFRQCLWNLSLDQDGGLSYVDAEDYVLRIKNVSWENIK